MGDELRIEFKNKIPTKAKPNFFQLGGQAQDFQQEMSWELRLNVRSSLKPNPNSPS